MSSAEFMTSNEMVSHKKKKSHKKVTSTFGGIKIQMQSHIFILLGGMKGHNVTTCSLKRKYLKGKRYF